MSQPQYLTNISPAEKNTTNIVALLRQATSFINNNVTVFHVKNYGAMGDGTTDDTKAINRALTDADAAGGGTIYLPAGTFMISAPLNVGHNVNLVGAGSGNIDEGGGFTAATSIKLLGSFSGTYAIICDPVNNRYAGTIGGFKLDGAFTTASGGIKVGNCNTARLYDIVVGQFLGASKIGILLTQVSFPASDYVFERVEVQNCNGNNFIGLYMNGCSNTTQIMCHYETGIGTNNIGCLIDNASDTNTFYGCVFICNNVASGIALKITGAGFNNNFFGGIVQGDTSNVGTMLYASNNSQFSHLYGTFLSFGGTVYTDGDGNGKMSFHDCLFKQFANVGNQIPITVPNNSSATIAIDQGLLAISDIANGGNAIFLCAGGNGAQLVASQGGSWTASSTAPTTGHYSVAYSGGVNKVFNNFGSQLTFNYDPRQLNIAT